MAQEKKYVFVDYLRVIALFLVLWDHIIPAAYYGVGATPPASIAERYIIWPLAITNYFGALATDLFFLVTGFLAMNTLKKSGPISYLVKRGIRLIPGVIFGYLFYVLLHFASVVIGGGGYSLVPSPVAYMQVNGLWYVRVLLYFCVISALCIFAVKKSLFMGTLLCQFLTMLVCQLQSADRGSIGGACSYIFYITVGMTIYVLETRERYVFPAFAILFVVAWYGIIHYNIAVYNPERAEVGNSFGVSAMYSILLFLAFYFANDRLVKSRVVETISKYSYGLYLHHMPVFSIVLPIIGAYALPLRVICYTTAAITMLLTFFASYIEFRWVATPCKKLTKIILRSLCDGQI